MNAMTSYFCKIVTTATANANKQWFNAHFVHFNIQFALLQLIMIH